MDAVHRSRRGRAAADPSRGDPHRARRDDGPLARRHPAASPVHPPPLARTALRSDDRRARHPRSLRVEADQRVPGELRRRRAVPPGAGAPLRPGVGCTGLCGPRRRAHRHPHRGSERGRDRCARAEGRADPRHPRVRRAGRHPPPVDPRGPPSATGVTVWGRSPERAAAFASRMESDVGLPVRAAESAREAVAEADVVCTVTAASEPVLLGAWICPGHPHPEPRRLEATSVRWRWMRRWWSARASSPTAGRAVFARERSS